MKIEKYVKNIKLKINAIIIAEPYIERSPNIYLCFIKTYTPMIPSASIIHIDQTLKCIKLPHVAYNIQSNCNHVVLFRGDIQPPHHRFSHSLAVHHIYSYRFLVY